MRAPNSSLLNRGGGPIDRGAHYSFRGTPRTGRGSYTFAVQPAWFRVLLLVAVGIMLVIGLPCLIFAHGRVSECLSEAA